MMGADRICRAKHLQHVFCIILMVLILFLGAGLGAEKADAAEKTGTVVIEALNVRAGAGTLNSVLGLIYMGDTVTIEGNEKDYAGTVWYKIRYNGGTGYVSSDYISINSTNVYVYDEAFEAALTAEGFPESYKDYLRQLHADYPNWVFQAAHTGIDWKAAVDAESKPGVTLVSGSSASSWKSTDPGAYNAETGKYISYDTGNWVTASRTIIEHYMDPRNFLNNGGIFQFMAHSYDSRTQTAEGLQEVLKGTFMSGKFPEETHATYNDVLMEAGAGAGVNPYVLASMILVEQGNSGNGKSISGTVEGYESFYNHFNVGAYAANGMDAVTRGLWYASQEGSYLRPWNSIYKSIQGGAAFYSKNYVQNNKYTLYFKKFNVLNGIENVGKGQYMTNVQGAESEAAALRKGYLSVMEGSMTFIIPVYQNMPETACLKPTSNANNDNYLASLTVNGFSLTPKFDVAQTSYTLQVPASVKSVKIAAQPRNTEASVKGAGTITLSAGEQYADIVVTAANGEKRVYTIKFICVSEDPEGILRGEVTATQIKISTAISEDNVVTVNWTQTSDCEMSYYEVYRSLQKNSGFGTKPYYTSLDGSEFSFSDSGNFEVGKTYYYKVRGVRIVDGEKVYTEYSNKAWRTIKKSAAQEDSKPVITIPDGVMATAVTLQSKLNAKGNVRLDWSKSPGYKVDYYEIYRSLSEQDGYGEVPYYITSSGDKRYYINSKGLKDGNTYYYKVRGVRTVNGQVYYTCWSNVTWQTIGEVSDDPDEPVLPETPQEPAVPDVPASQDPTGSIRIGVEATALQMSSSLTAEGKIRLDWSKSPGYKVDYYEVWRSTERYSGYGTVPYFTTAGNKNLYYTNTKGLTAGNTYYYRVRGVRMIDGEKVYTQWSNRSWRTIK